MSGIIAFLERHMLTCPSRAWLHIDCPGCGIQRSFISLLKGDIAASLQLYPATIPIIFLLSYTALHLIFKFSKGAKVIVFLQLTVAIIIVAFYIYKIYQHKIFN